jgi:hypothetical protein
MNFSHFIFFFRNHLSNESETLHELSTDNKGGSQKESVMGLVYGV